MSENGAQQDTVTPRGSMYLYAQPELLNKETHAGLGLNSVERPFDFAAKTRFVPLTATEFAVAQRDYPIVFSDLENPVPLAVVGVLEDINLSVGNDGRWNTALYLPAYLRCYPLALATRAQDDYAVVIDRAAAAVSEQPEHPFFEGDSLAAEMQPLVDFCGKYESEKRRTQALCQRVKELGLLTAQQATHKAPGASEDTVICSYAAVDTQKLNGLEKDVVVELHKSGALSIMFAHLFSLDNWQRLMRRRTDWQTPS